ncbi:hypothetical protein SEA_ESTES_98 [Mycobacterium phage Estes]|uniref:Uncharacterized protein n=1 Tax=Mycobacterium phage Estes TaxID=2759459 RepID=A0A7G9A2G8_9CAUD|nr:hypothetical protein J4U03_gp098 [Mycobacterium phage Estes]QNL30807.1 hypothetical protein SEA_ESTES_98 [Mycobacterium phage Estes]
MNATELAHWRYRLKALPADIVSTTETLRRVSSLLTEFRHAPSSESPERRELREEALAHWVGEHDEVNAQLKFERWLLEEAKYMAELGAIQRRLQ